MRRSLLPPRVQATGDLANYWFEASRLVTKVSDQLGASLPIRGQLIQETGQGRRIGAVKNTGIGQGKDPQPHRVCSIERCQVLYGWMALYAIRRLQRREVRRKVALLQQQRGERVICAERTKDVETFPTNPQCPTRAGKDVLVSELDRAQPSSWIKDPFWAGRLSPRSEQTLPPVWLGRQHLE